jgi:serine protease Do
MKRNIVAAIGLIGLGIFLGVLLVSQFSNGSIGLLFADSSKDVGAAQAPVVVNPSVKALNDAFVAVSEAVNPTVVSIAVEIESGTGTNPFRDEFREFFKFFGSPEPDDTPRRSEASGSGVIISSNGYIVTNNHVVENATKEGITVTLLDKRVFKGAKLIGTDPLTDLAVIKIDAEGLHPAHFGNIEKVKVGDFVFAVGNPLGLNSTLTSGIISAIGRGQLNLMNRDRYSVENFIQTDAAINPGNSGGGLFNLEGSLIGINTAIATRTGTYIGYGFAIPVDLVYAVVTDLIEDGKIDRGYIGVSIKSVDATEAKTLGLQRVEGVLVQEVLKDSPAESAGVEIGDIILELDSKPVSTSNELQSMVVLRKAGDIVKLTIWRDGKKIYKNVKLKPRDKGPETAEAEPSPKKGDAPDKGPGPVKFDNLGFTIEPANTQMLKEFEVKNGVSITRVERYSVASQRGLTPNGIIVKADRKNVGSVEELRKIINSKQSGDGLLLQVKYKDNYRIVALEVPGS